MFLSVCHRHQCMDYISVCYDSGELLFCEIWCIETATEDHRHHSVYRYVTVNRITLEDAN